jgi:hypothetical protein
MKRIRTANQHLGGDNIMGCQVISDSSGTFESTEGSTIEYPTLGENDAVNNSQQTTAGTHKI